MTHIYHRKDIIVAAHSAAERKNMNKNYDDVITKLQEDLAMLSHEIDVLRSVLAKLITAVCITGEEDNV